MRPADRASIRVPYGNLTDRTDNAVTTVDADVAILQSEYDQLAWLEHQMIDWWNTMWYYNLLPGLESMTRQLNVGIAHAGVAAAI